MSIDSKNLLFKQITKEEFPNLIERNYKLYGVCSLTAVFHSLDSTKVGVHNQNFIKRLDNRWGLFAS